jgi:phage tail-like protein
VARDPINDFLQAGRFHVLDVSFSFPPVLLPVFGFRGCTLPELSINIREIVEGNYEYPRKVVSGASVGNITLQQGVSLFNSDFWDWARKTVVGNKPPKDLMIVQFTRMGSNENLLGGGGSQVPPGLEFASRIPGRAWVLKKCRPARYKPGTDFDGMSQEVSIAELDLAVEEFEEFSVGL